ncbi:MAG: hypothetical protein LBF68_06965 [Christensenellaceae bacterium]|nr:hypothetical protein [Christensenellaceae bacterium]
MISYDNEKNNYITKKHAECVNCRQKNPDYLNSRIEGFEYETTATINMENFEDLRIDDIKPFLTRGSVVAFVGGSFNENSKRYGSGILVYEPNNAKAICINWSDDSTQYQHIGNKAGKIFAALTAISWAIKNEYSDLIIIHDCDELSNWEADNSLANSNLFRRYNTICRTIRDVLRLDFIKAEEFIGNECHDYAIYLAEIAAFDKIIYSDTNDIRGVFVNFTDQCTIDTLLDIIDTKYPQFNLNVCKDKNKVIRNFSLNTERVGSIVTINNKYMLLIEKLSHSILDLPFVINEMTKRYGIICDFIEILGLTYVIYITNEKLTDTYNKLLSNLVDVSLQNKTRIMLWQCVRDYLSPAHGDYEFGKYVFSPLKLIEGVIKHNINKCGLPIFKNFNLFYKNDDAGNIYKLLPHFANQIVTEDALKTERLYNYYSMKRHSIFHYGSLNDGEDDKDVLVMTKDKANLIISETLKLINNNYII